MILSGWIWTINVIVITNSEGMHYAVVNSLKTPSIWNRVSKQIEYKHIPKHKVNKTNVSIAIL